MLRTTFAYHTLPLSFSIASHCYASKDASWCGEEGLSISRVIDDYEDRLVVDRLEIRE
jgi:hypothetical protein